MVQEMLQYKTKIDQLKQEKTNLTVTYEVRALCLCVSVCERERKRALYPAGLTSFQSRAFSVLLRNRISGLE